MLCSCLCGAHSLSHSVQEHDLPGLTGEGAAACHTGYDAWLWGGGWKRIEEPPFLAFQQIMPIQVLEFSPHSNGFRGTACG